ncbi:MAG TPA: hypothetical protein DCS15_01920 [Flavobacteriales bacterium]|nr:CPBP family intramembrane metalloprotease [Salibacteraceae bacterium]HAS35217.1 hypothetical protein [Flavobacteriales bacterium]
MKRSVFLGLGWLTLVGFSALGFLVLYFVSNLNPKELFQHGLEPALQVALGLAYGSIAAGIGWLILRHPKLRQTRLFYSQMIQGMRLRFFDIIFISICAGVGEEILFRGAMQFYLNPWLTALIFVAIHGYLNPKDLKITAYGMYMTLVIGIMGVLYEEWGMLFAMSAHFAIDVVLLQRSLRDF